MVSQRTTRNRFSKNTAEQQKKCNTDKLWKKCGDRTERYDAKFTTESIESNSLVLFSFVQLLASTLWLFLLLLVFLSLSPFIHFLLRSPSNTHIFFISFSSSSSYTLLHSLDNSVCVGTDYVDLAPTSN